MIAKVKLSLKSKFCWKVRRLAYAVYMSADARYTKLMLQDAARQKGKES